MRALYAIALTLVIVGALNWGLIGLFDVNVVAAIFGIDSVLSEAVYIAVGIAGLIAFGLYGRLGKDHAHDTHAHQPEHPSRARPSPGVTPTSPHAARATNMATARTHTTATPMGEAQGTGAPGAGVEARRAAGTTHDHNAVTTGSSAEPTHDVYPPRGERPEDRDQRLN